MLINRQLGLTIYNSLEMKRKLIHQLRLMNLLRQLKFGSCNCRISKTSRLRNLQDWFHTPIGIVLCKNADKAYVEYAVRDYDKPMGVATYKTASDMPDRLRKALPDIEELKKLL